jgi:Domain of unknown function (DUF1833)
MARTLTPRAVLEAQRENSSDTFLVLLTIHMAGTTEDIRVVNNTVNVASRQQIFTACPFSVTLPDDMEYSTTSARLSVDNVDPSIWQGIRQLGFAPEITLEVIVASEPDTVVMSTVGLKLREASATKAVIAATLVPDTIWQQGFPEGDFDPPQNQGMFTS